MTKKLRTLYNWFDIQRDYIIKGHEKEWVLISDYEVLGYFSTLNDGVAYAKKIGLKVGNFLVQMCITSDEELRAIYNADIQFEIV